MISKTLLTGYLIWGLFIAVLFCLRPGSKLHKGTLETADSIAKRWLAVAVLVSVIILCVLPWDCLRLITGRYRIIQTSMSISAW